MSIGSFFKGFWNLIRPAAHTAEDVTLAFFSAGLKDAETQLGIEGEKIVHDAVAAAEAQGGSGEAKLAAALAKATEDLAADSITVALHILRFAVEGAVAQLNASNEAQKATKEVTA